MASQKVLEAKSEVVNEITQTAKNSASFILFDYRGLTAEETTELRRILRDSDSSYKVWCMNSQEGSCLYNAKTRKSLKSRKLFQNNEDTMFYISVHPEDEFEYAYMKTRLVDGFAEDEMTTKIDADSLEIMESYSVVRPNLVTYPYEMEEDDRNQVYSSHFESFVANNYRNALNLENKIAELAQKLGVEDIEALQKANDQVLQKVISQKMR